MRQKLAFCCAWIHAPRLVLMDEPLTGLDPRGIRSGKQAIVELAAAGAAVILSSHLLELVEQMAHRILILDRGKRVFLGTIAEARATIAPSEGSDLEAIFMAATEQRAGVPAASSLTAPARDGSPANGDAPPPPVP
jgi:ABC-2 type transport system ATP-binding protein